jgi:hypothetical protein
MNTFELRFFVEKHTKGQIYNNEEFRLVYQEIWIDGQHLDEPYPVCLMELTRSLFYPGEFTIFTCGCGYAGCASIFDGIFVRHEPEVIRWRFRRPVSSREFCTDDDEEGYDGWIQKATWSEYVFDRNQMLTQIADALHDIRSRTDSEDYYSPDGFERSHLDALDPYGQLSMFSYEEMTGQSLFFLPDDAYAFLLDGRFVTIDDLQLTKSFQNRFKAWREATYSQQNQPETRQAWLDETIAFLCDAYQNGFPSEINFWMITHALNPDGTLNPWRQKEHRIIQTG